MAIRMYTILAIVVCIILAVVTQLKHPEHLNTSTLPALSIFYTAGPGFFYTLGVSLIPLLLRGDNVKRVKFSAFICLGSLIYAVQQLYTAQTFDLIVISAIVMGALIGVMTVYKLNKSAQLST